MTDVMSEESSVRIIQEQNLRDIGPVSTSSIEDVDLSVSRIDTISQNGNNGEHYDAVNPKHYQVFPDTEALDIIKAALTPEEFKGFLKGNFLKYRLRAGFKDDVLEDLDKSHVYRNWLFDLKGRDA